MAFFKLELNARAFNSGVANLSLVWNSFGANVWMLYLNIRVNFTYINIDWTTRVGRRQMNRLYWNIDVRVNSNFNGDNLYLSIGSLD